MFNSVSQWNRLLQIIDLYKKPYRNLYIVYSTLRVRFLFYNPDYFIFEMFSLSGFFQKKTLRKASIGSDGALFHTSGVKNTCRDDMLYLPHRRHFPKLSPPSEKKRCSAPAFPRRWKPLTAPPPSARPRRKAVTSPIFQSSIRRIRCHWRERPSECPQCIEDTL